MDQVPSQQPDIPRGAVSPVRETRTLAVREYEESIAELRKENFDLKLQLYLKDQSRPKNFKTDAEEDDRTVTVQIIVDLQGEVETLRKELSSKDKLLRDALAQSEIHASHIQELQKKFVESQEQVPLEWQQFKEDKEIFEKENEFLKNVLAEKDTVILEANAQIKELSGQIDVLAAKVKRRSLALQGLVYKYHNDVETIPKESLLIVQTAVQAAKDCKEEELNSAIRELKSSLRKLMPMTSQEFLGSHEQDENQDPSYTKTNSVTELHNSSAAGQGEVSLPSQQKDSKIKFVHVSEDLSSTKGKILSQSLESIDESANSFGSKDSDSIEYMVSVLKDNEQLKCDNEEKMKTIQDLNSTNNELERRSIQLHNDLKEAMSKVKLLESKFKDEYIERKSLEDRLTLSNQVNHDLMEHLRKLETFLEDLLQNKNLDSSILESLGETSEVLTRLTSFLDDTRRLSIVLSDQISVCEKSKLFDPKDVSVEGDDYSQTEERSPLKYQSSKSIDSLTDYSILQGTLKSPFVCKKYLSQSQCSDNLTDKSQLQIVVNSLCDKEQKRLEELNENFSSKAREMDSFSKEKLELVSYIKELEKELKELKIKKEELALKLSEHTEEKDKLQIVVDDLHDKCNKQGNKLKELNDNYSNKAKEIDNFSKENLKLVNYNKELEEEIKELKIKMEELALKLSEYTEEKDKLQIVVDDLHNICNKQENKLKELNDNYNNKVKEMDSFSKEKLELVSYIKKLEEELKEFKIKDEELAFKLSEHSEEKDKLQIVVDDLHNACNIQENKLKELNDNYSNKAKEIDNFSKENFKLVNYNKELEEELKKLKAKEKELALHLSEYAEEKDKLQIVVDDLRNTCNNQKKNLEELNENNIKEIDNFSKEKAEFSSYVKKLEKELKEWKGKEKELAPQLSESIAMLKETNAENVKLKNSIKSLETKAKESDYICEELKLELEETKKSLQNLNKKCTIYETELSISANSLEDYKHKLGKLEENFIYKAKEIEALSEEKLKLLSFINALESDIKESKIREEELTLSSSESSIMLNEYSSEIVKLKNDIKALESKANESDSICNKLKQELRETKIRLQSLDEKCTKYEMELSISAKSLEDYKQKYNNVDKEKNKSVTEVLELVSAKQELLRCIQHEKEKVQQILSAKNNLEEELEKKSKHMNVLQSQYYELETKSSKLLEGKEKELRDSNSICAKFKEQIEKSNESFENLIHLHTKSKEKAQKLLKVQDEAKGYLLKVKNILLRNIHHVRDAFQQYLDSEEEGLQDVDAPIYLSEKTSITDKDEKIKDLFTNINTLNTKFEKVLCDALSSVKSTQETMEMNLEEVESLKRQNSQLRDHIKTQKLLESEDKTLLKKSKSEVEDLQQGLSSTQNELKATKACVESMQAYVEHMKQSLEDREKSLEQSKVLLASSEAKLDSMQKQVEKHQDLLVMKNKEISELQSTVLNAQSQLTDALLEKRTLASQDKMSTCEPSESLETKLATAEQQIEILEKEKGHLREHLLTQVRKEKIPSHSSEDLDFLKKKLADLQGLVQVKSSCIKELKIDVVRTCNALEDKQKEVDDLRCKISDTQEQCADTKLIIKETEIKLNPLKKCKQELIQSILSQQKQFFELRDISLGHLEKFQSHIEKLHSFCFSTSKFKSGSEPFWNSFMPGSSSYAEKCKELLKIFKTELELDVECLKNINIFLKRFVIPLVLQPCKQCQMNSISSPNYSQCETEEMVSSSGKLTDETNIITDDQISKNSSGETVCIRSENTLNDRLLPATYALAHKIESMDSLLKSVKPLLKTIKKNLSSEETHKQAKCTSSLQKLSEKIFKLQEKTDEIFHISDALKSLLQADSLNIVNQKEERSQESLFQRSLFSSPDLGIESDQCHETVAAEQAVKYPSKSFSEGNCSSEKQTSFGGIGSFAGSQVSDHVIDSSDTLHAIGVLKHFEFLKKEVQESLAGIKSVISRANYGLDLVANCTSPKKNLEFNTFKAIKEAGENIKVCLEEAGQLVGKFRIAPYPSSDELNKVIQQNLEMQEELKSIFESKKKQEDYFDEAMARLKQTERAKKRMEKKIAKKLVTTKKVLRQAEIKLLEGASQDLPSMPQK